MKKFLFTIISMLLPLVASAYDAKIGPIFYNLNSTTKTAEVTYLKYNRGNNNSTANSGAYGGSIVIPEEVVYDDITYKVTSIGEAAFCHCDRLISVTIPNSIITIGEAAFCWCHSLASVSVGDSVSTIGETAFFDCTSLTSISLPSSVTIIGKDAFAWCNKLSIVSIQDGITTIGSGAFKSCGSLSSITIPNSVSFIGGGAFYQCASLSSMNIPNGLTIINESVFYKCSGLSSINIPTSVTIIDKNAFNGCSSLTSVVIPNSVVSIGESVFDGCTNLKKINIGKGTNVIGSKSFANCKNLVDVTCKAVNVPQASTDAFENSNIVNASLHVFESAIENYRAKSPWKEFKEIGALSPYTLTYMVDDVVYKTYEMYEGDAITPEPDPTKEGYTFSGWSDNLSTMPAYDVVITGTFTESTLGQCATPTILFAGKKYRFECETPDAEFESILTTEEHFTGSELPMENREIVYTLTVYATAPGYERSEPAKVNFIIDSSDVNQDGSIDVADIAAIIDKMAGKDNKPGKTQNFTVNGVSFTMIGVEGGTFQMGSDYSDALNNEKPVHQVTVSSFSIGQTEVTQALWYSVMGTNPSEFKSMKLPVEMVSWDDCQTFITKLNQLTGQKFRLPTEAEWEFAAQGGIKSLGYKYAGSNYVNDVAWYSDNENFKTHEVGTKWPNELDIYDMSGNVWEWCSDWYEEYTSDAQTNPTGPESGDLRVFRGGGYLSTNINCRIVYRASGAPSKKSDSIGFRLAL